VCRRSSKRRIDRHAKRRTFLALAASFKAVVIEGVEVVGFIIVSFGIFWLGEGLGLAWPGGDLAVVAIIAVVFALAYSLAASLRLQLQKIRHDGLDKAGGSVTRGSRHQLQE
jgi:uncharacterized membrane protein